MSPRTELLGVSAVAALCAAAPLSACTSSATAKPPVTAPAQYASSAPSEGAPSAATVIITPPAGRTTSRLPIHQSAAPVMAAEFTRSGTRSDSPTSSRPTFSPPVSRQPTKPQILRPSRSAVPRATSSTQRSTANANTGTLCTSHHLRLAFVTAEGAAGTGYWTYSLTNTGSRTCTTKGYPGVSYLDAAGHVVQHPALRNGGAGRLISLATGHAGYFVVSSTSIVPNPDCAHAFHGSRLRVYPPNNTVALYLHQTRDFCDLRVGTVGSTRP